MKGLCYEQDRAVRRSAIDCQHHSMVSRNGFWSLLGADFSVPPWGIMVDPEHRVGALPDLFDVQVIHRATLMREGAVRLV